MVYPFYKLFNKFFKKTFVKVKALELFRLIRLTGFSIVIYIFKYRKVKAIPSVRKGFKDHRSAIVNNDPKYIAIFRRLVDFYKKVKTQQEDIEGTYRTGKMWQSFIDLEFEDLITALRNNNIMELQKLLENFSREGFTRNVGIGHDYGEMKKNPLYKYQYVNSWHEFYGVYTGLFGRNLNMSFPLVGNPTGLSHDGQIISLDVFRYHYYAEEVLSLLQDVKNPVFCEIGSGMGGQAYKIISNSKGKITCILLDIPEVLVIASYFLMTALPQKKFLLFGEDRLNPSHLDKYDIILMPNFMLPRLKDNSVDLFFNSCSFSEMEKVTVEEYIIQIERICRKYLFHINHTAKFVWNKNGKEISNLPADQIRPNCKRFKKIYQHPRLFSRLEDKIFYLRAKARHFAFLYERISSDLSEM